MARCNIDCPEAFRCLLRDEPTRCATYRAIKVKHLKVEKDKNYKRRNGGLSVPKDRNV